jgi:DNA-binding NarL/FixJ family response regulator
MTRILIADDHEVVRDGVRAFLERHTKCVVVAEAADGEEAITTAIETEPDVALLDYSLPLLNGLEVTRQIRARLPRTEVLIFTVCESELVIEEAFKAGARGYLLKYDANRYLLDAIASVATSAVLHEQGHGNFAERLSEQTPKLRHSNRERIVVQMIARNSNNRSGTSSTSASKLSRRTGRP